MRSREAPAVLYTCTAFIELPHTTHPPTPPPHYAATGYLMIRYGPAAGLTPGPPLMLRTARTCTPTSRDHRRHLSRLGGHEELSGVFKFSCDTQSPVKESLANFVTP
jgi:hypothetical protein